MKKFNMPEMDVIWFTKYDVIITSNLLGFSPDDVDTKGETESGINTGNLPEEP